MDPFMKVDPARLALREDQTETLRENQLKLVHFSKLVFDLLVASLDQVPSGRSINQSLTFLLAFSARTVSKSAEKHI